MVKLRFSSILKGSFMKKPFRNRNKEDNNNGTFSDLCPPEKETTQSID